MGRRLYRILKSEQLESRRPLAADLAALDINDDMSVTAIDALLIINAINQPADRVSTAEAEGQLDCDTNDDGVVTPIDVLNVVNQINSGIIAVPTDETDPTTSDPTTSVPTDNNDDSVVDTNSDDTVDSSPDDSANDDSATDDSGSDSTDDSSDDTEDSDADDDDVGLPNDGTDDDTSDESTDDDTSDDDSSGDDSSTDDDSQCDHDHAAGSIIGRVASLIRGHHGRGGLFAEFDANDDGALTSDEVPEGVWDRLLVADTDDSDSVTKEELQAYREAQRVAAVEAFFEQLDSDDSGDITSAEVSRMAWRFISRADANNDGAVTIDELLAVPIPGRWGGH